MNYNQTPGLQSQNKIAIAAINQWITSPKHCRSHLKTYRHRVWNATNPQKMDEEHNMDSYTFISNKPNKGNSDRRINPRPRRSIVRSFRLRLRLKAHDKNNPKDQNFSNTTNLPTQRKNSSSLSETLLGSGPRRTSQGRARRNSSGESRGGFRGAPGSAAAAAAEGQRRRRGRRAISGGGSGSPRPHSDATSPWKFFWGFCGGGGGRKGRTFRKEKLFTARSLGEYRIRHHCTNISYNTRAR